MSCTPPVDAKGDWAAGTLALIPEPGRSELVRRLSTQFTTTYHELCVAAILQSAGLCPEYEVDINGSTPDWLVTDLAPMIVEVWTRQIPEEVRSRDRRWNILRERLASIPVAVWLHVLKTPGEIGSPPDSLQVKQIEQGLKHWLLSTANPPLPGSVVEIGDFTFRLGGPAPGARTLIHTPTAGAVVTTDTVLTNLYSKVRRYRYLANKLDLPLLVVVAGEKNSAMDIRMVQNALNGVGSMSMTVDPLATPGQAVRMRIKKWTTNVPARFDPALTAVGWVQIGETDPGTLTLIDVPSAARSLPEITSPLIKIGPSIAGSPE